MHKKLVLDKINKLKRLQSGCNIERQVKKFKAAWNWRIDFLDMPAANPFTRQPKAKTKKAAPHYMPPMQDIVSVLKLATNQEHNLILYKTLLTAARKVELLRLTWDAIDFTNNRIGLRTRKRKDGVENIWTTFHLPQNSQSFLKNTSYEVVDMEKRSSQPPPQLQNGAKVR